MATGGPGQLGGEAVKQVEDRPCQNDHIIDVQMCLNDLGCITNTFKRKKYRDIYYTMRLYYIQLHFTFIIITTHIVISYLS